MTPIVSSKTTLSHCLRSVFILRWWHQHQRLEKTVSFSEMYRFRYLLGLQHSINPQTATRVGPKWLFFIFHRFIDFFLVFVPIGWVLNLWCSSTTRWKRTTISFPLVIVSMHLVGRFAPNFLHLWLGVGSYVSKWPPISRVKPFFCVSRGLCSFWGAGINTRG